MNADLLQFLAAAGIQVTGPQLEILEWLESHGTPVALNPDALFHAARRREKNLALALEVLTNPSRKRAFLFPDAAAARDFEDLLRSLLTDFGRAQ